MSCSSCASDYFSNTLLWTLDGDAVNRRQPLRCIARAFVAGRVSVFASTPNAAPCTRARACVGVCEALAQELMDKCSTGLLPVCPQDLGEAKSLKKPPAGVDDITAVVIVLLENNPKDKSWGAAQKLMSNVDKFLDRLKGFKVRIRVFVCSCACVRVSMCAYVHCGEHMDVTWELFMLF